jgi:spermidine/putrescine transport system substrate-binding protein
MTMRDEAGAPEPRPGTTRRGFLGRAATTTSAGLSLSALLAACGSGSGSGSTSGGGGGGGEGPGGLPLARPDRRVTLPIYAGNKAIASGLPPEKGPLQLYNWDQYMNPAVIKDFERKYGVKVQLTTFSTIDEAVTKISSGAVEFDLFDAEPTFLQRLVVGKLLQPINHSYIPNLKANVWQALQSPWYDVGSRYSVPYTVYTTGIGWRADKLPGFDPAKLAKPWSALWQTQGVKGKTGMLDDQHEGLAMGLLYNGVTDLNTEDPKVLDAAAQSLTQLVNKVNLKFDTNEYQRLAEGSLWLHQGWSGDIAVAPTYLPKGVPASAIRYWWPNDGHGPTNNDMFVVVKGAKNPVLAHLFLNHLLDTDEVFKNYTYTYYQQPIEAMTPAALIERKLIPPTLRSTVVERDRFGYGLVQGPLSQNGELAWQTAWAKVKSA